MRFLATCSLFFGSVILCFGVLFVFQILALVRITAVDASRTMRTKLARTVGSEYDKYVEVVIEGVGNVL